MFSRSSRTRGRNYLTNHLDVSPQGVAVSNWFVNPDLYQERTKVTKHSRILGRAAAPTPQNLKIEAGDFVFTDRKSFNNTNAFTSFTGVEVHPNDDEVSFEDRHICIGVARSHVSLDIDSFTSTGFSAQVSGSTTIPNNSDTIFQPTDIVSWCRPIDSNPIRDIPGRPVLPGKLPGIVTKLGYGDLANTFSLLSSLSLTTQTNYTQHILRIALDALVLALRFSIVSLPSPSSTPSSSSPSMPINAQYVSRGMSIGALEGEDEYERFVENARRAIEGYKTDKGVAEDDVSTAIDELTKLSTQIVQLGQNEIEKLETSIESTEEDIKSTEQTIEQLKSQLSENEEKLINAPAKEKPQYYKPINDSRIQLIKYQADLITKMESFNQTKMELSTKKSELENFKSRSEREIDSLQLLFQTAKQIRQLQLKPPETPEELQQQLQRLEESNRQLESEKNALQQEKETLKAQEAELRQQGQEVAATVNEQQRTLIEKINELTRAQQIIDEKEAEIRQLASLKAEKEELEKQLGLMTQSQGEILQLQTELDLKNEEIADLQQQLATASSSSPSSSSSSSSSSDLPPVSSTPSSSSSSSSFSTSSTTLLVPSPQKTTKQKSKVTVAHPNVSKVFGLFGSENEKTELTLELNARVLCASLSPTQRTKCNFATDFFLKRDTDIPRDVFGQQMINATTAKDAMKKLYYTTSHGAEVAKMLSRELSRYLTTAIATTTSLSYEASKMDVVLR